MKIVVILGQALDPAGIVVNRRRGRIFVNREEYVMQPADACALEAALRIKEGGNVEVVALPRGPLPDDDVLRQALSMGVDQAIILSGDGLGGARSRPGHQRPHRLGALRGGQRLSGAADRHDRPPLLRRPGDRGPAPAAPLGLGIADHDLYLVPAALKAQGF